MGSHFLTPKGSDIARQAMAAELLDAETEVALARACAKRVTNRRCTAW